MKKLSDEQMLKVVGGGGIGAWTFIGIGALIVFISGIITGYVNPSSCVKSAESK